jgi:tetratricopeptide (TPR) repeat protein
LLHRSLQAGGGDPRDLLQLAQEAEQAGQLSLAETALAAAAENSDSDIRQVALRGLIGLRSRLGRTDQALEDCRRLSAVAPQDALPWVMQARLYREKKQLYLAAESYRQALELVPEIEQPALRGELLTVLIESRNLAEARAEADRLPALPSLPHAVQLQHALLLRLENRPQDALEAVNLVLESQPDAPAALMLRGEIKLDLEDHRGAVEDLEEAVRRLPFNKECHYKLAMGYRALGDGSKAEAHARRSQELGVLTTRAMELEGLISQDPHNAALRRQLAEIYEQLGAPQRAEFWRAGAGPSQ